MRSATFSSIIVGFGALRANPLRTFLATLGIIVGAAALVAVLALGDGMARFGRQQLSQTTDVQAVVIQPILTRTIDGQEYPLDDYLVFSAADGLDARRSITDVEGSALNVSGSATLVGPTGNVDTATVNATLPQADSVFRSGFARGHYFTEMQAESNAPVVVLSHALALRLGGASPENLVGQEVRVRERKRTVVGVLAGIEEETHGAAFIPLEGIADALEPTPRPRAPTLILKAASIEQVAAVQRGAEEWLEKRFGDWKRKARISTQARRLEQAAQAMMVFKLFMGAITGISLLVGGIGIMNVLLASVTERTRELGIRKAIGARQRDLLVQFLAESVAIAGAGSLIGVALGLVSAFALTGIIRANTQAQIYAGVSWGTVTVAALSAIIVGLGFGLYPALRAARLSPIEAIRHE
ncbi:MAG: ABC transporter permease [Gemmatimonadota bacterium]